MNTHANCHRVVAFKVVLEMMLIEAFCGLAEEVRGQADFYAGVVREDGVPCVRIQEGRMAETIWLE